MSQVTRSARHASVLALALLLCGPLGVTQTRASASAVTRSAPCRFILGFARLRQLIGPATVGACQGNERYQEDEDVGSVSVQVTTRGRLSWEEADNATSFTDGMHTWLYHHGRVVQTLNAVATLRTDINPGLGKRCGKVRWNIKTLEDSPSLTYLPNAVTLADLATLARPATYRKFARYRYAPVETTIFTVTANLSKIIREADNDYHLVLDDGAGRQMVAEFPHEDCINKSPIGFQALMTIARDKVKTACGIADEPATITGDGEGEEYGTVLHGTATIVGVGFFDFIHNSSGQLPNFVELHPVLRVPAITCSRS